jgi:hypothetical protein
LIMTMSRGIWSRPAGIRSCPAGMWLRPAGYDHVPRDPAGIWSVPGGIPAGYGMSWRDAGRPAGAGMSRRDTHLKVDPPHWGDAPKR